MKHLFWIAIFSTFLITFNSHSAEKKKISSKHTQLDSIFRPLEDSLLKIQINIYTHVLNETERKSANEEFIHGLVDVLKKPNSFAFAFDSLKGLSIVTPPDKKFRIITWHFPKSDGSYRYYGAIQFNSDKLALVPLFDMSENLINPTDSLLTHRQWYGARYYDIVQLNDGKQTYYALLGWKGQNFQTTQRIIEVVQFLQNFPSFGKTIFSNQKKAKRIIFTHTQKASMMLKYLPQKNMIVFDHLIPPNPSAEGLYEFYGPDLTYDAYKIQQGKLRLSLNLDLRNNEDIRDVNFINPNESNNILLRDKLSDEDVKYVPK